MTVKYLDLSVIVFIFKTDGISTVSKIGTKGTSDIRQSKFNL